MWNVDTCRLDAKGAVQVQGLEGPECQCEVQERITPLDRELAASVLWLPGDGQELLDHDVKEVKGLGEHEPATSPEACLYYRTLDRRNLGAAKPRHFLRNRKVTAGVGRSDHLECFP